MTTSEIILLDKSQIDKASQTLVAAFSRDPIFQYIQPQEGELNHELAYDFWKASLKYCQTYNCIYTTPRFKGIAFWAPPGEYPLDFLRLLQSGFYKTFFQLGFKGLIKGLPLFTLLEKYHKQDICVPHWYLFGLGVSPAYQGQGIGGLLIQPILQKADKEGLPCYLETSTPGAVRFYQKYGFEILRTGEQPVEFWTMKREPIEQ